MGKAAGEKEKVHLSFSIHLKMWPLPPLALSSVSGNLVTHILVCRGSHDGMSLGVLWHSMISRLSEHAEPPGPSQVMVNLSAARGGKETPRVN